MEGKLETKNKVGTACSAFEIALIVVTIEQGGQSS
jgi:hypothetical protein